MFKKQRSEIKKMIQLEQAAWESDKNILSLNESDDDTISIGYATHSIEDYQELVPLVLDIMDQLLKDCTVFTWLKTPHLPAKTVRLFLLYQKTAREGIPNFAAQYAAEKHPETFFDGKDELVQKSQGVDRALIERFYQIPNCETAFQHTVYGFYNSPEVDPQSTCEDIHFSVVHSLADYAIVYRNFHVELNIRINPATVSKVEIQKRIQEICKNCGKKLAGYKTP